MAESTILNFNKSVILGTGDPTLKPNLMQIGLEIAEIDLFMYFQDGGRLPC